MKNFISTDLQKSIEADERAIASRLRNLRVSSVISLEEFAEALGVEADELASYEDGSEDVPASVIALVCALSGVPFEYFFGAEDESEIYTASPRKNIAIEEHAVFLS